MQDSYQSLREGNTGLFRDRGSKFIAYAFPMGNIADFEMSLGEIKKDHPKARHFCYAYILGLEEEIFRHNDDGEPGGSAGLPIYNQLRSYDLHYAGVVVVRYFGGTKLGIPGLINAYKQATREAIDGAIIHQKYIVENFRIEFEFSQTGQVMRVMNEDLVSITENGYTQKPYICYSVRKSKAELIRKKLLSHLLKRDIKDIDGKEEVPGFSIFNTGI